VPNAVLTEVRSVTAASMANELFADGPARAVAWLRHLRGLLPGRTMLIADYYGRLGYWRTPPDRKVALHDYIQIISGQGVPPPDLRAWRGIYRKAGCTLLHALEDPAATNFVHILRL
jgi:hypothetical protein